MVHLLRRLYGVDTPAVLFCSRPRVDHTMDVLSPFISVLCYSVGSVTKRTSRMPTSIYCGGSLSKYVRREERVLITGIHKVKRKWPMRNKDEENAERRTKQF